MSRGMARASLDLIEAMRQIAEEMEPITGRGVGYQLFTRGLISSMAEMPKVYRLLVKAREAEIIPWSHIVDETRETERVATWDDPAQYARAVARSYRRDFWAQQPVRVLVVSEKGTVRGILRPVLDEFQVGFLVLHGFSSATKVNDLAEDDDGRPLVILYVGDHDPSGLYMSEEDLPGRLERYGGDHVEVRRIALLRGDLAKLPSFPASDKSKDPRYRWFVEHYENSCWELDAMDPRDLRERVEAEIEALVEPEAWARCKRVNRAEQWSMRTILSQWKAPKFNEVLDDDDDACT